MRLTDILAPLQRKPLPAAEAPIDGPALQRSGPMTRSIPAARGALTLERLPDPPPLDAPEDVVEISREASFVLAAARYDPHRMSPIELQEMAGDLRSAGAIGAADYALLMRGPGGGYQMDDPDSPRDQIADWQLSLSESMNRPDLRAVGANTRALNILGRVAAARDQV
ncbi:MAG: hypothetical protein NXI21_08675 [Alphaproteobacteria bacterium]|nr:hypothetical protein [Alphaproteobacteria bacterium]